jgi:type IV pilus assembly protein PilM
MAFFRKTGIIGLELDTGEARAVELRGSTRAPVLAACGSISLSDDAIVEGMVLQPDAVAAALEELWDSAGIAGREVILGVANQGVMVRHATFPKVPENKIDRMIRYQAQDYLPVPLDTVVLDYMVIGETADERGQFLEVLLVAARRDMLEKYLAALSMAALKPRDINVSSLALLQVLPEAGRSGTAAIVDVANGMSNILVVADGVPRMARLLPIGLKDAAKQLGCALDEVVPPPGTEEQRDWSREALQVWIERLADEIRSSISYYYEQPGSTNVGGIVLSGRGARIGRLSDLMQESLGIPATTLQPLQVTNWSTRKGTDIVRQVPDYAVCLGLMRCELGW